MFVSSSDPVKDAKSAKKYLATKSWFLQEEELNPAKFSHILLIALLIKGIPPRSSNCLQGHGLCQDAVTNFFADSITSKATSALYLSLSQNADLLATIAKDHAESLVQSKKTIQQTTDNLCKLESLLNKTSLTTNTPLLPAKPSWAQIAATAPSNLSLLLPPPLSRK